MKVFMHGELTLGSATAAKRYLRAHPEVETVQRWWWVGCDLIECEDYSRDEMLNGSTSQLEKGATAHWAQGHGRLD